MIPESQPIHDDAITGRHGKLPTESKATISRNQSRASGGWIQADSAGLSVGKGQGAKCGDETDRFHTTNSLSEQIIGDDSLRACAGRKIIVVGGFAERISGYFFEEDFQSGPPG